MKFVNKYSLMTRKILLSFLLLNYALLCYCHDKKQTLLEKKIPRSILLRGKDKYIQIVENKSLKLKEDFVLYPIDEAEKDKSFKEFRYKLMSAVQRKELAKLSSYIHKQIETGAGENVVRGKEKFFSRWRLDTEPERSLIWSKLSEMLSLGGYFIKRSIDESSKTYKIFKAPYATADILHYIPEDIWDKLDPYFSYSETIFTEDKDAPSLSYTIRSTSYSNGIILGKNVHLRAGPSLKAKIIGKLSYSLIHIPHDYLQSDGREYPNWTPVKTFSNIKGYVYSKYVTPDIDFVASFVKINGKWGLIGLHLID